MIGPALLLALLLTACTVVDTDTAALLDDVDGGLDAAVDGQVVVEPEIPEGGAMVPCQPVALPPGPPPNAEIPMRLRLTLPPMEFRP